MWEHASTFAGVNRELWPLARMTFLPALEQLTPGPVRIAMNDRRVAYDAQRRGVNFAEQEASLTPAGGRLEPEEIAPLAVYLASDEARMVTGQASTSAAARHVLMCATGGQRDTANRPSPAEEWQAA